MSHIMHARRFYRILNNMIENVGDSGHHVHPNVDWWLTVMDRSSLFIWNCDTPIVVIGDEIIHIEGRKLV